MVPRGLLGARLLVGLGVVLVTLALLLPAFVHWRLKRLPTDVRAEAVSIADQARVIDVSQTMQGRARTETGVPLRIHTLVKAGYPSDSRRVTLVVSTALRRADRSGSDALLSAHVDRVTLDRATAIPVADPPAAVSTESGKAVTVPRRGVQYQFPFDSGRRSHLYFDWATRSDRPIHYSDDARKAGGLQLYHFRHTIGPVNLRLSQSDQALTLPASAWGLPGDEPVRFDLWYRCERDIWVEPTSGVVVEVREHLHRFLGRNPLDPQGVTTLDATTKFDEQTLAETTAVAARARSLIRWGTIFVPIGLALLGLVVAASGTVLWRRTMRSRRYDG